VHASVSGLEPLNLSSFAAELRTEREAEAH
jgi:hypothetical protein